MRNYEDNDWDNRAYYDGVLSPEHQRALDRVTNPNDLFDDPDELVDDDSYDYDYE